MKIGLGAVALIVAAIVGAGTASIVLLNSIQSGTAQPAPPPSASAVHDANVKLCTLYYSAGEAFAKWDATHPSKEQKDGTAGASVFLVTAQFLEWALTQAPDADQNLRANVQAEAKANIDAAGIHAGKPDGLVQPPTYVPDTAWNEPSQKIYDFCIKGG
ncbi:hypothetical protein [Mycobacteroides chelonae]|uniref:hypothetical protein n=1 Tax=Mycobacteroides chelonae TaxID=1774 RepID=UPI00099336C8|nr:hypothetical protein [Mycobacteroides chelonae]